MDNLKDKNILLVTPNPPWPPHTGSAQRTALIHAALSEIGNVSMICLHNPDNMEPATREVLERDYGMVAVARRWGDLSIEPWNTLSRFNQTLAARLGNLIGGSRYRFAADKRLLQALDMPALLNNVDLVVGRYTTSLTCLGVLNADIPCVIDVDDLDSATFRSHITAADTTAYARWTAKRQFNNVVRQEPKVLRQADGLWIANPDDQQQEGLEDAVYLPNIPFFDNDATDADSTASPSKQVVGVIASYKHHPNVEAVDWFLNNVWRDVLVKAPKAVLKVYGSQINDSLHQRWSAFEGVEVVGFVDDVATAYADMSISICPVQRGAGTNVKVLESAHFKRLCIMTTSASRGLTGQTAMLDALVICNDANEMSEKVAYYLENPTETARAATKLYEAVRQHYSRQSFYGAVHALVRKVLG